MTKGVEAGRESFADIGSLVGTDLIKASESGLKVVGVVSTGETGIMSEEAGGMSGETGGVFAETRAGSDIVISFGVFWEEVVE